MPRSCRRSEGEGESAARERWDHARSIPQSLLAPGILQSWRPPGFTGGWRGREGINSAPTASSSSSCSVLISAGASRSDPALIEDRDNPGSAREDPPGAPRNQVVTNALFLDIVFLSQDRCVCLKRGEVGRGWEMQEGISHPAGVGGMRIGGIWVSLCPRRVRGDI